jgi:hypothetical protein
LNKIGSEATAKPDAKAQLTFKTDKLYNSHLVLVAEPPVAPL